MTEPDLFGTLVETIAPAEPDRRAIAHDAIPNFYEVVAKRKLGVPASWQWFQMKVVGPDVLLTGAVPIGYKRNGNPKWPPMSQSQTCAVTTAEFQEAREAWERETGLCYECGGCGERSTGWSKESGRRYARCLRCVST